VSAVLELVCGRCGHLFMRWDSGEPHDGHAIDHQAVRTEAPGSYLPASDGKYYRWAPGPAAETPDGEVWGRYTFRCPNGCPGSPQARTDRLHDAAEAALRALDEAGEPLLRTTVDAMLRFSA
jgi:hypothetical protein